MKLDKVLFLMEQYCDADPRCGPTNSEHLVADAVKSTSLVRETKRFYFDQLSLGLGRERMSGLLLEDCQVFQPDLVIFTPLGGALGDRLNPSGETISKLGAKVYAIVWDAKPACGIEVKWLPYVDYLGIVDSIAAFRHYRENRKVLMAYSAANPLHFYDKGLERDIDVSFLGSIDPSDRRWPMRTEYTGFLRDNGINMVVAGGQRGSRLSVKEYCDILNRSKISLSFCRDGSGMPCLKSKVFEITSCGAMLMDDWDTDAAYFLKPTEDFVIYHSKEELLGLVRHYLGRDDERKAIAKSGWRMATNIYKPTNMWGHLFEGMGFEAPAWLTKDENYRLHRQIMERI